ncbi:MAG: hypothetical protein ACXU81_14680, partial [Myxococcaceae bacterium]
RKHLGATRGERSISARMGGGWTAGSDLIWNRRCLAGRKDVSPVLLAATSVLPVSPSDLLAPLAAAVALLLLRLVGRPAPVRVRRNRR